MRRIVLALMSTLATVVLLLGYRTSTPVVTASPATVATTGDGSATDPTTAAPTTPSPTASAVTSTVVGTAVETRYGPVQVQVSVTGGTISDVTVLQQPSGGRSAQISSSAILVLEQETLDAQSAQIDSVSGATYTSQGYVGSLQSALDQAGR